MHRFPLQLTHLPPEVPKGTRDAWLLPGRDVSAWIRALCAAGIPNLETQPLYLLPQSSSNREVGGLFVPAKTLEMPQALPYALYEGRVFIPSEARFPQPLTEIELASLFIQDVNLYHPRLGLVAFDPEDALYVQDLLTLPPVTYPDWNRAHPGLLPEPGHLKITAQRPSTDLSEMLQSSRGDIGTQSPSDIPPEPGESKKTGKGKGDSGSSNGFFQAVKKFTQMFPTKAGAERTWVNRLEDWADRNLEDVQRDQEKEVDRLLNLFRNNPDEGLRFALPIGGEPGRGYVAPNTRLPERHVDFNLGGLGGGQSISPWMLGHNQTKRLAQAYRDAANRELQLGRHRRAAYIFAHLLNDFAAAANALKAGHYYREAAAIYEDKIKNTRAAAACLREGGLLEEAVRLYEKLEEHETVAEIYLALGREDAAMEAYERAVEHFTVGKPDILRAARILEIRLRDPERAAALLLDSWPEDFNAKNCLQEYFHLQAREDSLDVASETISSLLKQETDPDHALTLAEVLAKVGRSPGPVAYQNLAKDATRVVVGRFLALPDSNSDSKELNALRLIRGLDTTDLLLTRDTRRFGQHRRTIRQSGGSPAGDSQSLTVQELEHFAWPANFVPFGAAQTLHGILSLGHISRTATPVLFHEKTMHACRQEQSYWVPGPWHPIHLVPQPVTGPSGVHPVSLITQQAFPRPFALRVRGIPEYRLERETPSTLGMAYDSFSGKWSLTMERQELYLARHDAQGALTGTHHISMLPEELTLEVVQQTGLIIPMAATERQVLFALSNHLGCLENGSVAWQPLSAPIRQLAMAPPYSRGRVALSLDNGVGFVWLDRGWKNIHYFGHDLQAPQLLITRSGHLVAADEHGVHVYRLGTDTVQRAASYTLSGKPVALIQGTNTHEFYLVGADSLRLFGIG